jgi:hypothetical protein
VKRAYQFRDVLEIFTAKEITAEEITCNEPWDTNHHHEDSYIISGELAGAAAIGIVLTAVVAAEAEKVLSIGGGCIVELERYLRKYIFPCDLEGGVNNHVLSSEPSVERWGVG